MRLKRYGVILEEGQDWQPEGWLGQNDCGFRTALAAIAYDDFGLMCRCKKLLQAKERWPKELETPSKQMTRDPYIMTICAYTQILIDYTPRYNTPRYTEETKIPWYLYRPHVWAWRKYLITGSAKWKRRYERRAILGLKLSRNKVFALHLDAWMAYVADSDKVKVKLWRYIPSWNYLLESLTGKYPRFCFTEVADSYTPKIRYAWSMETQEYKATKGYSGPYQIDKDILTYILNK